MLNKERIQNTKTTTTTTLARLPSAEESWLPSESKRTGGQSVKEVNFRWSIYFHKRLMQWRNYGWLSRGSLVDIILCHLALEYNLEHFKRHHFLHWVCGVFIDDKKDKTAKSSKSFNETDCPVKLSCPQKITK